MANTLSWFHDGAYNGGILVLVAQDIDAINGTAHGNYCVNVRSYQRSTSANISHWKIILHAVFDNIENNSVLIFL